MSPLTLHSGLGCRIARIGCRTGLLLFLLLTLQAQNLRWKTFDQDAGGFGCGGWGVTATADFNPTRDAKNDPNSGSLLVNAEFKEPGETVLQNCTSMEGLSRYKAFALDVYVDPGAPVGADGTYGSLTVRFRPDWAWPGDVMDFGAVTNTGWTHLERPIPATAAKFSGFNIHWKASYSAPAQISFDNLEFIAKDSVTVWRGFDTDVGGFGCGDWGVTHTATFDPLIDVQSNPASGSLAVEAEFASGGEVSLQVCSGLDTVSKYDQVSIDVFVEPGSKPDPDGTYGIFSLRLRPDGFGWPGDLVEFGKVTSTGWTHLQAALPAGAKPFVGLNIHWKSAHTEKAKVWIDNVAFITSGAPAPPPTLTLAPTVPGLEVVTSGSGNYSRKNIATVAGLASQLSWVNAGGPVRYSLTINEDAVGPDSAGYVANILIIGTEASVINPSPDWNEPNGIFLEAGPDAEGRIQATVRYKKDAAGGHGLRFEAAGLLIENTNSTLRSLVGTWSLILDGPKVTLTGPGDIGGTATLPAEVLPAFSANTFALFGAQPYTRKDRRISLARVEVSGPTGFGANLRQDFTITTAINADLLELKEEDAGGIRLKPNDAVYRASWNLPDDGYALNWNAGDLLKPSGWSVLGANPVQQGLFRTVYLSDDKAGGTARYYRLIKP